MMALKDMLNLPSYLSEAISPPVRTTLPQLRLRNLALPFRPLPDLVLERPQFDLGEVELVPRAPEVRVARGVLAERPLPQQVPRLVHRPTQRQRLPHALEMKWTKLTLIDTVLDKYPHLALLSHSSRLEKGK